MKDLTLFAKSAKHPLLLSIIATFAIGCSPSDPDTSMNSDDESPAVSSNADSVSDSQNNYGSAQDSSPDYSDQNTSMASAGSQEITDDQSAAVRPEMGDSTQQSGMQQSQANGDWSLYREFSFNDSSDISSTVSSNSEEIAAYVRENPELQVGLDGADEENVDTVRESLISVGVPEERIELVELENDALGDDGRVAVLFRN